MFNTETKSFSPEETFTLAEKLGETLKGGEIILLSGGLGAGKTLFTKGVLSALDYDIDEVTSPSFTLVNLYKTEKFDVFHIDFWRLNEKADVAQAVGLDEIIEDETAIVIMEWSEKLRRKPFSGKIIEIKIEGDGDEPRMITVSAA